MEITLGPKIDANKLQFLLEKLKQLNIECKIVKSKIEIK